MNIGLISKALNAAVGVLTTTVTVAMQNGHMEFWEWFTVIGSTVLAGLGVFFTDNTPRNRAFKAIAAAVVALGGFLATAYLDQSISYDEWIGLAGVVLTAFMTWYAPNAPASVNGVRRADPGDYTG